MQSSQLTTNAAWGINATDAQAGKSQNQMLRHK